MRRVSVFAVLSTMLALSGCAPEGSTAYVSFNVKPSADCIAQPSSSNNTFIGTGVFDIGVAIKNPKGFCAQPYYMNLQVNSNLRANAKAATGRAEPNILQVHSAQVRLMTLNKETLKFERKVDGKLVRLPNPFLVTTGNTIQPTQGTEPSVGVVQVNAIPVSYAHWLDQRSSEQILVEVQIFGTTLGDVDIDFKPFVFPLQLCEYCEYQCGADLDARGVDRSEVYGDECNDNAGADGRPCIDDTGMPSLDGKSGICDDDPLGAPATADDAK